MFDISLVGIQEASPWVSSKMYVIHYNFIAFPSTNNLSEYTI